ncbi:hypothetical protein HOY80DRAFT_1065569 [Tuber brumale]|nr:hypothetical protein HOY80DRAFT_1065569 [Tuber brumale]
MANLATIARQVSSTSGEADIKGDILATIAGFTRHIDDRLTKIDDRITKIDDHLTEIVHGVDKRFNSMDENFITAQGCFNMIDDRLTKIDNHQSEIVHTVNKRFNTTDENFSTAQGCFNIIEQRFNQIEMDFHTNNRFHSVDDSHCSQATGMDQHFNMIDQHFNKTNQYFDFISKYFSSVSGHFGILNHRLDKVEQQVCEVQLCIDSNHYNSAARLENSCTSSRLAPLCPLRTSSNEPVPNFPPNKASIDALDEIEINALLSAYDLPTTSDLAVGKLRFACYIGITHL